MMLNDLESFKVSKAPATVYYIPNFITTEEENFLTNCINSSPKPKWTQLSHRRLQNWGGIPHRNGMIAEDIPQWLTNYVEKVNHLRVFADKNANHILINEYLPGQGIMPHLDGPLFYPTVTTISLGSHTVLEFYEKCDEGNIEICNLLLDPRSLVILKDDMYKKYLHQINERKTDIIDEKCANLSYYKIGDQLERKTRISLTIRHVPKTSKVKIKLSR